jgi:hypothetical protein
MPKSTRVNKQYFFNIKTYKIMATKLKVVKATNINPKTRQEGFSARVITNGKAGYEDIVLEACHNTTLHKAEAKVALELCMESAANMLKQGMIVDLGPVGKLYPSCSSGWFATAEELQLDSVKPGLYFRPAEDVESAIKGARLVWAKAEDEQEITPDIPDNPGGGDTPGGNDNPGGDDNGGDLGE